MSEQPSNNTPKISFKTAIAIVVANMVGAGVFTSIGYQAAGVPSVFPILLLWLIGGIVAISGALCYGELASMFPRSGGEYNYLSKIYHPAFGFLSGWISATVGFAAPIAMAAMALGTYAHSVFPYIDPKVISITVVLLLTVIHSINIKVASIFQQYSTLLKAILIISFIGLGLTMTSTPVDISILPKEGDWELIFSSGFAISLAFVSFSYSGWNAAAYVANEIENPTKNVPKSILVGAMTVMLAYLLINYVFLYTIPVQELASKQGADFSVPLEVGYLSAEVTYGSIGAKVMGGLISLLLVSSISAMIFAGPRVTQVMGEDLSIIAVLGRKNKKGIPFYAILLQTGIAIILILSSYYNDILFAIAFILDVFTFSTVLGLFVMRIKEPNRERKYKAWGYPITPIIFLLGTGWTMFFLLTERPKESGIAVALVLLGLIIYCIDKILKNKKND